MARPRSISGFEVVASGDLENPSLSVIWRDEKAGRRYSIRVKGDRSGFAETFVSRPIVSTKGRTSFQELRTHSTTAKAWAASLPTLWLAVASKGASTGSLLDEAIERHRSGEHYRREQGITRAIDALRSRLRAASAEPGSEDFRRIVAEVAELTRADLVRLDAIFGRVE